jgi:DNA modification methylase
MFAEALKRGVVMYDLRLGDCLDPVMGLASLADKSVDVIATDPPYSEHVHANSRRGSKADAADGMDAYSRTRDLGFAALSTETMGAAANHFARLTRRWVLVFSDTESSHLWREALTKTGELEYVRTCFWDRVASAPQFTGDRPAVACEAITVCHRPGKKAWNGGGRRGIYSVTVEGGQRGEPRLHTAQKPLVLMEALLRDFSNHDELILDPFAGSGTTGVAAIRLGRRFVGFERDEKFHAVATSRLAATREQLELFGQ